MNAIGISQLVSNYPTTQEFLRAAAAAGYQTVELSLRAKGALTPDIGDAEIAEIVALSKELGLRIDSLTIGHGAGNLLASGDAQEAGIAGAIFGLEMAAKFGATVALHTLGSFSPTLYYEDAYANAIDSLKKIAPAAEKLGVSLAWEFTWGGFGFSPLEVRRLLDEVGSDFIGFYFDPGNMAVFQFPHHWIRAIGTHIKRVHLKDWQGRALNGGWTPLTEGGVDFVAMMSELRAIGYDGPLTSEVPESLAPWADTAVAIGKIREL